MVSARQESKQNQIISWSDMPRTATWICISIFIDKGIWKSNWTFNKTRAGSMYRPSKMGLSTSYLLEEQGSEGFQMDLK